MVKTNKKNRKRHHPSFFSGRRSPAWAAYRQLQRYAYADLILPYKTEPYATDGNTYLDERRVSPILERRYYEMTNHLDNVQATLLEYRISPVGAGAFVPLSAVTYGATLHILSEYTPRDVLVTICDEKDNYRFGFNGQEKDNEAKGIGNHNTALFWEYDTRTGRRWNVDPKPKIGISDYSVMLNNPIQYSDVLGDDTGKVFIPQSKWPNVFKTHLMGLSKNPNLAQGGHIYLNYDPSKSNAQRRRAEAKSANGAQSIKPEHLDEFPYASTKEGGANAAVNSVPASENMSHGGYLGSVVVGAKMKEGDVFDIVLIPDKKNEPKVKPAPLPVFNPQTRIVPNKPYMGYPGQGIGQLLGNVIKWLTGADVSVPDPVISPVPAPVPVPAL